MQGTLNILTLRLSIKLALNPYFWHTICFPTFVAVATRDSLLKFLVCLLFIACLHIVHVASYIHLSIYHLSLLSRHRRLFIINVFTGASLAWENSCIMTNSYIRKFICARYISTIIKADVIYTVYMQTLHLVCL